MDITSTPSKKSMSRDEVACLVDLIQGRPIITTKETNATTNKLKDEAWFELTASFNAKCGSIPRNKIQLKLKWDNLKKAARKRSQQIRINNIKIFKTGGGKSDNITPDDKVASLLGSTCSGFDVPFGGDAVGNKDLDSIFVYENLTDVDNFELYDARPEVLEDLSTNTCKKRKVEEDPVEQNVEPGTSKFLYGLPLPKPHQNKGTFKNKTKHKYDQVKQQRNISITKYYDMKCEKLALENELLRIKIEKKKKGCTCKDDLDSS